VVHSLRGFSSSWWGECGRTTHIMTARKDREMGVAMWKEKEMGGKRR
jgi:hypothetical protein